MLGFNPDLPKIIDIAWQFEDKVPIQEFVLGYNSLLSQPDPKAAATNAILAGQDLPPLTIYFNKGMKGVTRRTLSVRFDMPLPTQGTNGISAGVYLPIDLRMYGDILEVTGAIPTPHTGEIAPYAVSFLPRMEFFLRRTGPTLAWPTLILVTIASVAARTVALSNSPQVIVALKGDFVVADMLNIDTSVLDGDNIGGKVGDGTYTRPGLITGGKNPSGNMDEGGLFESWFFLDGPKLHETPAGMAGLLNHEEILSAFFPAMFGMKAAPPTVSFSSAAQIAEATGVPAALAERIVQERAAKPFTSAEDLKRRLKVSNADGKLQSKLVML